MKLILLILFFPIIVTGQVHYSVYSRNELVEFVDVPSKQLKDFEKFQLRKLSRKELKLAATEECNKTLLGTKRIVNKQIFKKYTELSKHFRDTLVSFEEIWDIAFREKQDTIPHIEHCYNSMIKKEIQKQDEWSYIFNCQCCTFSSSSEIKKWYELYFNKISTRFKSNSLRERFDIDEYTRIVINYWQEKTK